MRYDEWIMHFNPNHDPKNGQFTDKKGGRGNGKASKDDIAKQIRNKRLEDAYGAGLKEIKDIDKNKAKKKGLTPQQKKMLTVATVGAIGAVGVTAGIVIAHRLHATEKIKALLKSGVSDVTQYKDVMTQALDDETEVLKSGSIIDRIQFGSGIDVSQKDELTFGVYKPRDRAVYMTLLEEFSKSGAQKHRAVYETIQDIKLPTEKKAREIFERLWNEDPKYQEALKKTIRDFIREALPAYKNESDRFIDKYASPVAFGENSGDMFYKALWSFVKRGEDSQIFIDALKKEGYNAIHDYHDVMDNLSEAPVILFDPKGTLVKRGEELVTKATINKTLKGLLKAGETTLPTKMKALWPLNGAEGRLDINKLIDAVKDGRI